MKSLRWPFKSKQSTSPDSTFGQDSRPGADASDALAEADLDGTAFDPEQYVPDARRVAVNLAGSWSSIGASVIGPSHETTESVRQDEFADAIIGKFYVGAVCDGMGSALYAHFGAATCSAHVVQTISVALEHLDAGIEVTPDTEVTLRSDANPSEEHTLSLRLVILDAITQVRERLQPTHREIGGVIKPLYDTTLIGVICGERSGFFFHVGDGCGVAAEAPEAGQFRVVTISSPENGDFSDVTFPVTMNDFHDHFRITPFSNADAIFLMTDGVTPFALEYDEQSLKPRFLQPIDAYLSENRSEDGAAQLLDTLNSESIRKSDSDDKTLLWVRRVP